MFKKIGLAENGGAEGTYKRFLTAKDHTLCTHAALILEMKWRIVFLTLGTWAQPVFGPATYILEI